jgi:hypothetical protein
LYYYHVNKKAFQAKGLLKEIIAFSLYIHMLLALFYDVHPNPGPVFNSSNVTLCHSNIRSVRGRDKLFHIKQELCGKYDIIALTETWLSPADNSNEYLLQGYQTPMHRDRDFGAVGYGGVMVWVSDNIACKRRQDLELADIEAMWLEIRTINKIFFLCVVYRSESNTDNSFWDKLQENIDNVRANYNPKIMLCGDFNADPNSRHGIYLKDFSDANNFVIHIKEPTRITNTATTILDQFITNFPQLISNVEVLPPMSNCDHCLIAIKCSFKIKQMKPYKRTMWNFKEANFDLYRDKLAECDWNICFESDDVDNVCDSITESILKIAKATIPNKSVTVRPNNKSWYTNDLRKLKRKMMRHFKKAKCTNALHDWNTFKETRFQYQIELKKAKNAKSDEDYSYLSENKK